MNVLIEFTRPSRRFLMLSPFTSNMFQWLLVIWNVSFSLLFYYDSLAIEMLPRVLDHTKLYHPPPDSRSIDRSLSRAHKRSQARTHVRRLDTTNAVAVGGVHTSISHAYDRSELWTLKPI